jgi:hypothetical protein
VNLSLDRSLSAKHSKADRYDHIALYSDSFPNSSKLRLSIHMQDQVALVHDIIECLEQVRALSGHLIVSAIGFEQFFCRKSA